MTYGDYVTKATAEQRAEVRKRVEAIIGTKDQAIVNARDLSERIRMRAAYDRNFEKLAKIFYEHGEKALAMNFTQHGRSIRGVTASGKRWELYGNNGWTERSRYCGTLYIEGEGAVFTSGRLDRVFDYILNN